GSGVATQNLGSFVLRTSYDLYLGTRPSGPSLGAFYSGLLDETSLYNRALANSEIPGIFNAAVLGKCAAPTAPTIFGQPTSQAVLEGDHVTLLVGATGTHPLSFRWAYEGANIEGASSSSLTIENVQLAQAGHYSVVVTNP